MDIYAKLIYGYLKENSGHTVLMKDIEEELNITNKTVAKKIKWLIENGYIRRDGKKFFDLKE